MANQVLVVIDMQKFFFEENKDIDQQKLTGSCAEIIAISREAGVPIVHVKTSYRADRIDWPKAWNTGDSWCANLVNSNDLSQLVDETFVKPEDFVVEKKRFSAFYNTNLDDILRSLRCRQIFMIGYSADVCLRFTSVDAYNRGYEVTLIDEGIESFKESKQDALEYLKWLIDADVVSVEEYGQLPRGLAIES